MKPRLLSVLRNLLHKAQVEKDLDAEVRTFVGIIADEKTAAGAPRAEAERYALAECGGIEQVKQSVRNLRSGVVLEIFWQDLRFGFRQLRRNVAFAVAAILMLGIGIGANTAIFSFVNSVLLRPLPYPDSNRLTVILSELGNSSRAPASMVPTTHLEPLSSVVERVRAESRFVSVLSTLLSIIALQLALGGIYGVLSYSVVLRTPEIGVRIAIGAQRGEIMRLVFAEGFVPVISGIAAGAVLALISMPLLDHLLFGIKPGSPQVYALITLSILVLSGISILIPALRAMQVDPLKALACE